MKAYLTRLLVATEPFARSFQAVFLAGLAARLWLASATGFTLDGDAADYHQMALDLGAGVPFEPDWPPGLPLYLVPFQRAARAIGAPEVIGDRVAMLAAYLLLSWLLHGLARRLLPAPTAGAVVCVFALFPSFVYMSVVPLTQIPASVCLTAACWAAIELANPQTPRQGLWACLLGVALGCLILVRPSSVVLLPLGPLIVAYSARRLWPAAVAMALAVALVGVWLDKAHAMTGRWFFVNNANSQNLFYGNNPYTPLYRTWWYGSHKDGDVGVPQEFVRLHRRLASAPPAVRDHEFSSFALRHILQRPDLFVVRTSSRIRVFFAYDTFTGAQVAKKSASPRRRLLGLGIIGIDALFFISIAGAALARLCVVSVDRRVGILCCFSLIYATPYFVTFAHPTYHFPIVPLLALIAGGWLQGTPSGLSAGRRRALLVVVVAFVLVQVEWTLNMSSRVS